MERHNGGSGGGGESGAGVRHVGRAVRLRGPARGALAPRASLTPAGPRPAVHGGTARAAPRERPQRRQEDPRAPVVRQPLRPSEHRTDDFSRIDSSTYLHNSYLIVIAAKSPVKWISPN